MAASEQEGMIAQVGEEIRWLEQAGQQAVGFMVEYSFQILGAAVIIVAGYLVANWVARLALRFLERRRVDVTLRGFISSVVRLTVLVLFAIVALGKIGISITPFVAAIGGLAVGATFAFQGPISNYGAGLIIILTQPFRVGDTIRIIGYSGRVSEIHLAATHLIAEDGEHVTIPNRHIVGEVLVNSFAYRVVEGKVGISYRDSPARASDVVRSVLADDPDVATDPMPQVGIEGFGDSAVEIAYRYWVPTQDYFQAQYRVNQAVWDALKAAELTIPYPQRDVHLYDAARGG